MLKITLNSPENQENLTFQIEKNQQEVFLNGQKLEWDIIKTAENRYNAIYQDQSFELELIKAEWQEKNFQIKLNGQLYELKAQNSLDLLLEKMGMGAATQKKINQLKAPMPGLIVDIRVAEGQTAEKGEVLVVLEAMKMENVLKAPEGVNIRQIKVKKGQTVEKGQVLIEF